MTETSQKSYAELGSVEEKLQEVPRRAVDQLSPGGETYGSEVIFLTSGQLRDAELLAVDHHDPRMTTAEGIAITLFRGYGHIRDHRERLAASRLFLAVLASKELLIPEAVSALRREETETSDE